MVNLTRLEPWYSVAEEGRTTLPGAGYSLRGHHRLNLQTSRQHHLAGRVRAPVSKCLKILMLSYFSVFCYLFRVLWPHYFISCILNAKMWCWRDGNFLAVNISFRAIFIQLVPFPRIPPAVSSSFRHSSCSVTFTWCFFAPFLFISMVVICVKDLLSKGKDGVASLALSFSNNQANYAII